MTDIYNEQHPGRCEENRESQRAAQSQVINKGGVNVIVLDGENTIYVSGSGTTEHTEQQKAINCQINIHAHGNLTVYINGSTVSIESPAE